MITNKNIPGIHRKEWQFMQPSFNSANGNSHTIKAIPMLGKIVQFAGATTVLMYDYKDDGWQYLPNPNLGGSFGAGSCMAVNRWSNTFTATGGTTTSVVTTSTLSSLGVGRKLRILTGVNAGLEVDITQIVADPTGNDTIKFAALPAAMANGDTFCIDTGRIFALNGGTIAAGVFKSFDFITGTWSGNLGVTNLPGALGTDAVLMGTPSDIVFASGTSSGANTTTTLANTAKSWTVNGLSNYQIRITAGTGRGQIRTIASNTATVITVSAAWTTTPDATSQYEITGNDDFLYLVGNGAVTMYRYSISGNTWTVLAPTVARAAAPNVGCSASWISNVSAPEWTNESTLRNGNYIYSFRGGGSQALDRYDISQNKWEVITYINLTETFTSGSGYADYNGVIYIKKENTNRFYKYDVAGNIMTGYNQNLYAESTNYLGDRVCILPHYENGVVRLAWMYVLLSNTNLMFRILL